ncbi:MAG: S9 family peptidase [Flavobacteriales bacterium]|nr:MAG: S9 family peptidase [Flavobacteriales bacterium]
MKNIFLAIAITSFINVFAQEKELTLEDAVLSRSKGLTPKNMSGLKWIKGTNNYIYKENKQYIVKTAGGKEVSKIGLDKFISTFPDLKAVPIILSISTHELVFQYESQMIHFDYVNGKELSNTPFNEKTANKDYNKTNKILAYTIDNNLYISKANRKGKAFEAQSLSVTKNEDKNIVSGQAIHRYEFGIHKGTFWSPKGNFLAFYVKDETNVAEYPIVDVTTYPASVNNIKYPMAGQKSEMAKIGIYNVRSNQTSYLNIDTKDEHFLTSLSWTPDEKYVFVGELNRGQNHLQFNRYDVATGNKMNTIFEEKNDRWVEPEQDAVFLPNSTTEFIYASERNGFMNLYKYNTSGKLIKQLTTFNFPVTKIVGFDKKGQNVFVAATGKDAREKHFFKVNLKSGKHIQITKKSGVHSVQLSSDGTYLLDNFTSLTVPREIDVINVKSRKSNTIFKAENPLADYKIGTTELMTLKSKDGFDLHCRMIKPANFDSTKKYPVLVYVYGGPMVQLITNRWMAGASMWMHWLANQKDYIIFTLDNRGTSNRGFAFESIIHRHSGDAAREDQLIGVEYLKGLSYIDSKRMAVKGWSYGGYMTTSLMLRNPGVFKVGACGGPVTDWKYYEVMYGERYMDTPQENPEGYENTRVGKYLENLEGKLLVIHGSVDPTVVPQHSMTLLKEAVEKKVQLDFFTYPMHEHNVRGKDRVHLIQKMLDYIVEYNK